MVVPGATRYYIIDRPSSSVPISCRDPWRSPGTTGLHVNLCTVGGKKRLQAGCISTVAGAGLTRTRFSSINELGNARPPPRCSRLRATFVWNFCSRIFQWLLALKRGHNGKTGNCRTSPSNVHEAFKFLRNFSFKNLVHSDINFTHSLFTCN